MSSEETERAPLSFQVVDSSGVESTLELVETFRLEVKGKMHDYCLVRQLPPTTDEAEHEEEDPTQGEKEEGDDQDELQAYRLEDNGLASLEPGEETILLGQALLALQSVGEMAPDEDEESEGSAEDDEARRARH